MEWARFKIEDRTAHAKYLVRNLWITTSKPGSGPLSASIRPSADLASSYNVSYNNASFLYGLETDGEKSISLIRRCAFNRSPLPLLRILQK